MILRAREEGNSDLPVASGDLVGLDDLLARRLQAGGRQAVGQVSRQRLMILNGTAAASMDVVQGTA